MLGVMSMAVGQAGQAPDQKRWLDQLVLFRNGVGKLHFQELLSVPTLKLAWVYARWQGACWSVLAGREMVPIPCSYFV